MNKIIRGFLSLLLLIAILVTATAGILPVAADTIAYGYVNDDDAIDAADALLVLQYSVNLTTLSPEKLLCADVSGGG